MTVIRRTCGNIRRRQPLSAMLSFWAVSTRRSTRRLNSPTEAIYALQPNSPVTPFAAPDHAGAGATLASVLERLGLGAECATWRNCYLTGAYELRNGAQQMPYSGSGLAAALTITQLFDTIGLRIDGRKAWDQHLSVLWSFTDTGERYWMELSNGALIHHPIVHSPEADTSITVTRPDLLRILSSGALEGIAFEGDATVVQRL